MDCWYVLHIAISQKVNSSLHVLRNHNQRILSLYFFSCASAYQMIVLYERFLTLLKVKARIALPKLDYCGFKNKTKQNSSRQVKWQQFKF